MRVVPVAVAVVATGLGGCATLDRGSTDKVYVVSDPPGATAIASFGDRCTTPCALDVSRRDEFTLSIEKAGHIPEHVSIGTRLAASGVGDFMENVVSGGAGMVVDAATGATLEHLPNPVNVTLRPLAGAAGPKLKRSGAGS